MIAAAPPSASTRQYLRSGLPGVYRERREGSKQDPFAARFVTGLEEVLDPIVCMLDNLPAHFDLDLAPPEFVALIGEWLGLDFADLQNPVAKRDLVRAARSITLARGTRAGLEEVFALALGHLRLEVRDGGGATWSADPTDSQPAGTPELSVICPARATEAELSAIRQIVAELKPAHVGFELRIEDEEP